MTWKDRIRPAAYTGQDNLRHEFEFENVSRVTEKRSTAFSFPGIDDNYIQDNGFGSRKYNLRCYFTGDDCDFDATAFEASLLKFGVGKLEHPFYGDLDVVPFGTVSRRDDLVTGSNQAIVECTFWTTTGVVYPTAQVAPKNEVQNFINEFDSESSAAYGDNMILKSAQQQAELRGTVEEQLTAIDEKLSKAAQATEEVSREFRAWQQTINTSINVLVGNPVLLAQQLNNLVRAPARAALGIQNRLTSYVAFLQSIFTSPSGTPGNATGISARPSEQTRLANDWRTADLSALQGLVSMASAALETEYKTKPEALSVADALLAQLEAVAEWREAGYAVFTSADYGARIEVLDDGRAWFNATQAIYVCAGYLVQLAFSLASERLTVLNRDRSIVDVCAEFYGAVDDDTINFLINSNDLCGCQILELPKGFEMLWYPQ